MYGKRRIQTERYNVELCIEEEREDGTKEFHFCTQALEAAISVRSFCSRCIFPGKNEVYRLRLGRVDEQCNVAGDRRRRG
jgi:hypothetical protein